MESNRENALKFQIVYEKKLKVWPTKRVIFSHRILDHASMYVYTLRLAGWCKLRLGAHSKLYV